MTDKERELLKLLETRIRQMILQRDELQQQIRGLESQIDERDERIKQLVRQNEETAALYANLKVARMLELSDDDTRNARLRLGRLVREVDKCIALLKS